MRDQQCRLLEFLLYLQNLIAEQESCLFVECGKRLVHQENFGLGGERAGKRNALAHAAGKLSRITVLETVETHERNEMTGALDALVPWHAKEFEGKGDVVSDSTPGKCRFLLEYHADRFVRTGNRFTGDADDTLMIAQQAADDVKQCLFAASGRPDNAQNFPGPGWGEAFVNRRNRTFGGFEAHHDIVRHQNGVVWYCAKWHPGLTRCFASSRRSWRRCSPVRHARRRLRPRLHRPPQSPSRKWAIVL